MSHSIDRRLRWRHPTRAVVCLLSYHHVASRLVAPRRVRVDGQRQPSISDRLDRVYPLGMPPDRVIQDSDDEDDATSIDPLQDQSSVRRSSLAESNAGTVNGEQRYDAELEQLLPAQSGSPFSKINFDVFLQSPSQERGAQELSSSQQREERWIPAEIGSESVG